MNSLSLFLKLSVWLSIAIFGVGGFAQESARTVEQADHTKADYLYFLGDTGAGKKEHREEVLNGLSRSLSNNPGKVFFLGNSLPESAPQYSDPNVPWWPAGHLLQQASRIVSESREIYFLPGESEWNLGLEGILELQKDLRKASDRKKIFLPRRGCPLAKLKINDNLDILLIDSFWTMMEWDNVPGLNNTCDIKTREDLFLEIEHQMIKNQEKTLLIAMHHPLKSYGPAGNERSFGLSQRSINHESYRTFRDRLMTLSRQWENVLFISAHDHSLQLQIEKGIPIIVSGSASKASRIRPVKKDDFASDSRGFSRLEIQPSGAVSVAFFGVENNFREPIYQTQIVSPPSTAENETYPLLLGKVSTAIYNEAQLRQSWLKQSFFGTHYKKDYLAPISATPVNLDTLYGGLRVFRKGGGHQTNSLRLVDGEGKEYTMRSIEKSALRFLQNFLYKSQYLSPEYKETYFLRILQEYWTTAHPYGVLTVGTMSEAVGILHPNPSLYYVPRQNALGKYNTNYGDRLFFIEEHLSDEQTDVKSLGQGDEIINSFELLEKLRNRDRVVIDQSLYIRTRLFDNIVGDWDRHADQWKWVEYDRPNGVKYYKPIPRDRDQVYSDFGGVLLSSLTFLAPPLRFMQRYDEDYKHLKWFNDAGDDLDRTVLDSHSEEDWLHEARFLKKNLTEEVINRAFAKLPDEIDQNREMEVKKALINRINNVEPLARALYKNTSRNIMATGTDRADVFKISRNDDGTVTLLGFTLKDGNSDPFWEQTYNPKITRNIWLYGLAGNDQFIVEGSGPGKIPIRLIGGTGNDIYNTSNTRALRVYDHRSEPNTFTSRIPKRLSDNYELNTYHFKKSPRTLSYTSPLIGYEPDNELAVGFLHQMEYHGIYRKPFTARHTIEARYFTGSTGALIRYEGEFAHVLTNTNLGVQAHYESPHHITNFFGYGNESLNLKSSQGKEFNSVRVQNIGISPSLIYRLNHNSKTSLAVSYNHYEVERTADRFIAELDLSPEVFEGIGFLSAEGNYSLESFNSRVQPSVGLGMDITVGGVVCTANHNTYGYVIPTIRITNKLDNNGRLVLATKFKGHVNMGDHFEFFQAATIGGTDGPRGYRQQRFSGKQAYYQLTDLRLAMGRLNNGILPTSFSLYGGFDYGRVWFPGDSSKRWHTSYGGGCYLNFAGFLSGNIAYFSSPEGGRFVLNFSVPF